jgi:hypothetical protein
MMTSEWSGGLMAWFRSKHEEELFGDLNNTSNRATAIIVGAVVEARVQETILASVVDANGWATG